ncbi:hypothetical protein CALVIDRAFT_348335 [Calocera viscosa TUFC12733]|uniref:F-box domain-containing protein n=1 Tax=Calocera viscosa (strain TUFC12733) TaxID=1330018 RepID=A0A167H8V3_CALVF|nr:hypothetical protein CALVIDRAFT_348335 [Calocera viscosa TUFC12733]
MLTQVRRIVSDSLRSFRLVLDIRPAYIQLPYSEFTEATSQFLDLVIARAPQLTKLAVSMISIRPESFNDYLPTLVEGLPCIAEVDFRLAMRLDALTAMQSWICLQKLRIDLDLDGHGATLKEVISFPALKSLSISGWPWTLVSVFQMMQAPALREVAFPAVRPGARIEIYEELVTAVARSFPLLASFDMSAPTHVTGPQILSGRQHITVFNGLLQVRHLQHFGLRNTLHPFPSLLLDDQNLAQFATAWTSLRSLDLRMRYISSATFTLLGLLPLARHCRELHTLCIGFSMDEYLGDIDRYRNHGCPPAPALRAFELEGITNVGNYRRIVAEFIISLWPNAVLRPEETMPVSPSASSLAAFCEYCNARPRPMPQ